jgi:hypothetical protein
MNDLSVEEKEAGRSLIIIPNRTITIYFHGNLKKN